MNRGDRVVVLVMLFLSSIVLPVGIYVAVGWFIMPWIYPGREPEATLQIAVIVGALCLVLMVVLFATAVSLAIRWQHPPRATKGPAGTGCDGAARDGEAADESARGEP